MKKIIRYRLSISLTFPATHNRKGEQTFFKEKIHESIFPVTDKPIFEPKIHTIRANYQLWEKRFEKINKGEAVLELYYWSGNPYNSKCVTFAILSKDDGIGLHQLYFDYENVFLPFIQIDGIRSENPVNISHLAKNDGLSPEDFKE